jgi:hypothetical protein
MSIGSFPPFNAPMIFPIFPALKKIRRKQWTEKMEWKQKNVLLFRLSNVKQLGPWEIDHVSCQFKKNSIQIKRYQARCGKQTGRYLVAFLVAFVVSAQILRASGSFRYRHYSVTKVS